MIRCEDLVTDSRICDWIKDIWRSYKNWNFPISGDYYYSKIDRGILIGNIIDIQILHLPEHLQQHLNERENHIIQRIFFRAVKEIFAEKFGQKLTEMAIKENKIEIVLV